MKALLLGEAPTPDVDPSRPLSGRSGRRLARLLDLDDLGVAFDLANVLAAWPGRQGKGSRFPTREARAAAVRLEPELVGRRVVYLGRRVAAAFGAGRLPYLEWRDGRAVLPHPSGVNRWWNDPVNESAARAFLTDLLRL